MPQRLALLIGNGQYTDDRLPNLTTPAQDVDALQRVLVHPNIGHFNDVTVVLDQEDDDVKHAIHEFLHEKNKNDTLLLYYSGHGMLDSNGLLHLAARNSNTKEPRINAVSTRLIREWMEESSSKRLILVLDCCYSGAVAQAKSIGTPVNPQMAFEKSGTAVAILTASTATQFAWEGGQLVGNIENSVFTHYLVEGLETGAADENHDGRITLDEWYDYAADLMETEASKIGQTPAKWVYNQQGDSLMIARRPGHALPQWVKDLLKSSEVSERLEAVLELKRLRGEADNSSLAKTADETLNALVFDATEDVVVRAAAFASRSPELLTGLIKFLAPYPVVTSIEPIIVGEIPDSLTSGRSSKGINGDSKVQPDFTSNDRHEHDHALLQLLLERITLLNNGDE